MKPSAFEGWTREKQCFGPFKDFAGRFCALGWLYYNSGLYEKKETVMRIAPLLLERFPGAGHGIEAIHNYGDGSLMLIWANDILHLDTEVFISFDREALAKEEKVVMASV